MKKYSVYTALIIISFPIGFFLGYNLNLIGIYAKQFLPKQFLSFVFLFIMIIVTVISYRISILNEKKKKSSLKK